MRYIPKRRKGESDQDYRNRLVDNYNSHTKIKKPYKKKIV